MFIGKRDGICLINRKVEMDKMEIVKALAEIEMNLQGSSNWIQAQNAYESGWLMGLGMYKLRELVKELEKDIEGEGRAK